MFFKKYKKKIFELILIFLFIVCIYIIKPPCLFHIITGLDCIGCGATRMVTSLLNLKFKEAFQYNPFIMIFGVPIVLVFLDDYFFPEKRIKFKKIFYYFCLLSACIFFIIRNI